MENQNMAMDQDSAMMPEGSCSSCDCCNTDDCSCCTTDDGGHSCCEKQENADCACCKAE